MNETTAKKLAKKEQKEAKRSSVPVRGRAKKPKKKRTSNSEPGDFVVEWGSGYSMMGPALFGRGVRRLRRGRPERRGEPPRDSDLPPPAWATLSGHWQVRALKQNPTF